MPPPASLFLQRGRSDSMMLEEESNPSPTRTNAMNALSEFSNSASTSNATGGSLSLQRDESGAPLCTPPVTMTAFDNAYGPYGLLASAMSSSDMNSSSPVNHATVAHCGYPYNPRAPHLLRRTSSSSTLDSSEDEEDVAWSHHDMDRLQAVYEACVEEASFETPFSGAPPSQLLHAIAKACKRAYSDSWPHSISATRAQANQIAKEKERLENGDFVSFASRRPSVDATPKPPGVTGGEANTPRRKIKRNDSMDFLPESWDLDAVARLHDKLNKSGEDGPLVYHYPHRSRTDTCSSGSEHGSHTSGSLRSAPMHPSGNRLLRSMTFSALNNLEEDCQYASMLEVPFHHSSNDASSSYGSVNGPLSARPALRLNSGFLHAHQQQSHSSNGHQHNHNTLYHAPSTSSFLSEADSVSASESLYSAPSLNGSMDTMALTSPLTEAFLPTTSYGSSFASNTSSFSYRNNTSTAAGQSTGDGISFDGQLGTVTRKRLFEDMRGDLLETPVAMINTSSQMQDYFSFVNSNSSTQSHAHTHQIPENLNSSLDILSVTSQKRPSHPHLVAKPPLTKSYTFDAMSTSPSKKYMRLDDGWHAQNSAPCIAVTLGGATSRAGANLESPFEMAFEQSVSPGKLR